MRLISGPPSRAFSGFFAALISHEHWHKFRLLALAHQLGSETEDLCLVRECFKKKKICSGVLSEASIKESIIQQKREKAPVSRYTSSFAPMRTTWCWIWKI